MTRYEREKQKEEKAKEKEAEESTFDINITFTELNMVLEAIKSRMISFAKNEDGNKCLSFADLYHKFDNVLPF